MAETVFGTIEALGRLASFELDVHAARCVRVRNRHASCSRCLDACTSGALHAEDGEVRVEADLCVGCGTCATVCPTGALEAQHPNDAALEARARGAMERTGDGTVVFACRQAVDRSEGRLKEGSFVALTCLSRLEESTIVRLFADGATSVSMVHGDCAGCPREQGKQSAILVQRTVADLAAAWGLPCACSLSGEFPDSALADGAGEPASEEAALSGVDGDQAAFATCNETAHHDAAVADGTGLSHVGPDGTLPHFVPTRRNRLLDALATFGDPRVDRLDTRLWGHVTIDFDKCSSCRMCAVFCPTGAICKFEDEDGTMGIEHYVAECVHCRLCEDVCPEGAIVSESSVPALQLARGETERYPMPEPAWHTGPDQILRRMRPQIGGNDVRHSYGI